MLSTTCLYTKVSTYIPKQNGMRVRYAKFGANCSAISGSTGNGMNMYTIKRISEDACRVIGTNTQGPERVGKCYAMEEFFKSPNPCLTESLVYYPIMDQNKYGIQLFLENSFEAPPGAPAFPPIQHIRTFDSVPESSLEGENSEVAVRVVAGACEGMSAPPPLGAASGVTLWDCAMGPGEDATLPLPSSNGSLVYVLEGVALLDTPGEGDTCYANEGHGVWISPQQQDSPPSLQVRTHSCESARFLILSG